MATSNQCHPVRQPEDVKQLSVPKTDKTKETADQAALQRFLAVRFYDEVISIF